MIGKKVTLILQRVTETHNSDGMGGLSEAWQDIKKFKGFLETYWGREELNRGRQTVNASHIIRCNYFKSISANDRIRYGGRLFDIVNVENCGEQGIYLKIYIQERDYDDARRYY